MPEALSDEARRWQASAESFANDVLAPLTADAPADRARAIDASQQIGLFKLTQPVSHGGSEASQLTLCTVRDTLSGHNAPHADAVLGPGPGVLASVVEPLRSRFLEPLLKGQLRGGFGFTEPDDAPHFTQAVLEGDSYRVTGQKSYVTGGGSADFVNVLVHIDKQPALILIETTADGVERSAVFQSIDGSRHAAFTFNDVKVPASHVIAAPGAGMPKALGQIGDTRLAIAATCVGLCRWVYAEMTSHLAGKTRDGTARGDDPVARLRLGECYLRAFAARSMLYRTARLADVGENVVNQAMACKVFAVDALTFIVDEAIQLVGGSAVIEDHPLAQLFRRVRSLRLAEGATDRLLQNIARGRLELNKGHI
ncbi:MAG: acyl-CoA dehydrogenase [Pseudomonadota bacterium]